MGMEEILERAKQAAAEKQAAEAAESTVALSGEVENEYAKRVAQEAAAAARTERLQQIAQQKLEDEAKIAEIRQKILTSSGASVKKQQIHDLKLDAAVQETFTSEIQELQRPIVEDKLAARAERTVLRESLNKLNEEQSVLESEGAVGSTEKPREEVMDAIHEEALRENELQSQTESQEFAPGVLTSEQIKSAVSMLSEMTKSTKFSNSVFTMSLEDYNTLPDTAFGRFSSDERKIVETFLEQNSAEQRARMAETLIAEFEEKDPYNRVLEEALQEGKSRQDAESKALYFKYEFLVSRPAGWLIEPILGLGTKDQQDKIKQMPWDTLQQYVDSMRPEDIDGTFNSNNRNNPLDVSVIADRLQILGYKENNLDILKSKALPVLSGLLDKIRSKSGRNYSDAKHVYQTVSAKFENESVEN